MTEFGQMMQHMDMHTKTGYWRPTADTFAVRLLLTRRHLGLDVREAAKKSGIHYATWSTWEHGRRPQDFADAVQKISDALGVDPMWLAFGDRADRMAERPGSTTNPYPTRSDRPADTRPKGRPRNSSRRTGPVNRRPAVIRRPAA